MGKSDPGNEVRYDTTIATFNWSEGDEAKYRRWWSLIRRKENPNMEVGRDCLI
jgi:hypothetical protein